MLFVIWHDTPNSSLDAAWTALFLLYTALKLAMTPTHTTTTCVPLSKNLRRPPVGQPLAADIAPLALATI